MSVKFKTVKNEFPKMEAAIKGFDGKQVNVGMFGEHAWLAGIHEYGLNIKVTEKMRAYLHRQGLHLRHSTTEIRIPERSFLRSGFDEYHKEVVDKAEKILGGTLGGEMSSEQFLDMVGEMLASKIKYHARALTHPPKHPFTISQNPNKIQPLELSGDMIGGIAHRVEG